MENVYGIDQDKARSGEDGHVTGLFILLSVIGIPYLCLFYHLPVWQVFGFIIGLILFLYIPGSFILESLTWKAHPGPFLIISILAGMAASPLLYYLASITGQRWIFIVIIACVLVCVIYNKSPMLKNIKYYMRLPQGWWKFVAVFFIALTVLHFSHFTDLKIVNESGYQLRTTDYTESIYHLGIINAVAYEIPPAFPYASGYKLSEYHIDMHVLAVIFCEYLGIDPAIMTYYFLPLLLLGMILAVPAVFFYELHGDTNVSILLGLLMLGSDFSFIPALISINDIPQNFPWTLTFCTTIWSLFTLNGIMMAIPLFFGSALAFQRYFSSHNIRHLLVFALFTIAAYRVKSSMGIQVACVSFATLATLEWQSHLKVWRKALPVLLFMTGLIFLDLYIKSFSVGIHYVLRWDMFNGLIQSVKFLGIEQWENAVSNPLKHPFQLLYILILYFIGFMGIRLIFLKYFYDVVKHTKSTKPIIPFFLYFIIVGIILSEIIYLGGKYDNINNGVWFKIQSIVAATYFITAYIVSLKKIRHKIIAVLVVIVLSYPSTINFLKLRYDKEYMTISANAIFALDHLRKSVPGNAVIMGYPNDDIVLFPFFTGRSALIVNLAHIEAIVEPSIKTERLIDLKRFFMIDNEVNRKKILEKYNVEYLIIPSRLNDIFSHYTWVEMSYNNPDVTIYKIIMSERMKM